MTNDLLGRNETKETAGILRRRIPPIPDPGYRYGGLYLWGYDEVTRQAKLKIIIEIDLGPNWELGGMVINAKSPIKNGPLLKHDIMEKSFGPARELVKLCFDLENKR